MLLLFECGCYCGKDCGELCAHDTGSNGDTDQYAGAPVLQCGKVRDVLVLRFLDPRRALFDAFKDRFNAAEFFGRRAGAHASSFTDAWRMAFS
jgi:hypothetical protein